MRVKDLWEIFPLPAKIKLFWDRITLTRTTTIYFVFSILHCVVQVVFQAQAFQINVQAANFLASITGQGNAVDPDAFYVFRNDLRLCNDVSKTFNTSSCQVVWDRINTPVALNTTTTSINNPASSTTFSSPSLASTAAVTEDEGSMTPNTECLWTLGWPVQILKNTEREDITFIMFQIWVLGMSIAAILNESVPHTIAALLTHLAVTGWGGFQIFNTFQFHRDFARLTTNGACHSIDLLPTYWHSRSSAEIASLILNAIALFVSAYISWKLATSFSWQTFKRIGSSPTISRIYRIVLTLSIVTQLSLFFIVASVALWLDQLWNGAIGHLATSPLYRPFLIIILILLPLWLAFGWYSVRHERNTEMLIFLLMCFGYLAGWGAMFDSTTFRWTYMTWPFFAVMTTTSVLLTLLALILGIICWLDFGKGLSQYLKTQEPTVDGFDPVIVGDPEKADFPSSNQRTISVAFRTCSSPVLEHCALPRKLVGQVSLQQPSPVITCTMPKRTYPFLHRTLSQSSADSSSSSGGGGEHTEDKYRIAQ